MINFVIDNPDISARDLEVMFDGEVVTRVQSDDIAVLAVEAGIFPSRSQARKNGCGGTVPHGFHRLGTRRKPMWVWNPSTPAPLEHNRATAHREAACHTK